MRKNSFMEIYIFWCGLILCCVAYSETTTGYCIFHPFVSNFVMVLRREVHFLAGNNFNEEHCCIKPHLTFLFFSIFCYGYLDYSFYFKYTNALRLYILGGRRKNIFVILFFQHKITYENVGSTTSEKIDSVHEHV